MTVIFALEGRLRPYYGYLERELRAYPLRAFPLGPDDLLAVVGAILEGDGPAPQQRLLAVVEAVCRGGGYGDDAALEEPGRACHAVAERLDLDGDTPCTDSQCDGFAGSLQTQRFQCFKPGTSSA